MRTIRILVTFGSMLALAGCGGGAGHDDPNGGNPGGSSIDAARAAAAYNAAIDAALAGAIAVDETAAQATLAGSIEVDGVLVTFDDLVLEKRPYAVSGTATFEADGDTAAVAFSGGIVGALSIDGADAGTLRADFPGDADFARAEASWAMGMAFGGAGASFANGVTVTDNGDGTFTLDGTIDAGGILIDFDMVTIDPVNMTINGTISIDDGNGNTVVLAFNGTTVDVTVNGQLVGTFDLSGMIVP